MLLNRNLNTEPLDPDNEVEDIPETMMRGPIFTEEYQKRMQEARKFNFRGSDVTFFQRAGWFFTAKNDSGKIFYRVLGTTVPIVGTILGIETGIITDLFSTITNGEQTMLPGIELFSFLGFDVGWTEILLALAVLMGWALSYLSVKARGLGEQVVKILNQVAASIDEKSEAGAKLSEKEKDIILSELAILAKIVWTTYGKTWVGKLFGINKVDENVLKQME